MCQGQLVPISSNEALFQLLGTIYGGDGQNTFGLPDLQGRVPIHQGTGPGGQVFVIGQKAGSETVTLTLQQLPQHNHTLLANNSNGNSNFVGQNVLAANATQVYRATSPNPASALNASAITPTGGSQPHDNLQPYLTITWCISLYGIYPSQT